MPARATRKSTNRRRQIIRLLALGLTNKQIAAAVALAESTVKWHVSRALAAYGCPNRAALVRAAIAHGDVELDPA